MFFRIFTIAFLFISVSVFAQNGIITGKVVVKSSNEPLARASVFLSNATFGTATANDGTFTLSGIKPGQYELVVTSVGYENYSQTVLVGKDKVVVNAEMVPRVTSLREVVITSGGNWKRNYENFVRDFIGTSANAKKCRILNPRELTLLNHKTKKYLEASTYDFLDIDNNALGYKVKILLNAFKSDRLNNIISWEGKVLYQELPGSAEQKRQWEVKREEIYYGSSMQFFRALQNNKLSSEGFEVRILDRKPNPNRPSEELIQQKVDKFRETNRDSLNLWYKFAEMPKYDEHLYKEALDGSKLFKQTQQPGLYAIGFPGCLYVSYTKREETFDFKDIYRPLDMPNYETSIVSLFQDYALFDANGVIVSPNATLFEGHWSLSKVAELLPVDYVPGSKVN